MVPVQQDLIRESSESSAPHEDGALLFCAKSGDADAFRTLAESFSPMITKIASSFSFVPESEREDLFQEGLLALHKAVLLYKPTVSSFSTFAYLCVRHGMLNALKKWNRVPPTVSWDSLEQEPVCPSFEPEAQIIDQENCAQLLRQFETLLSEYEGAVLKLVLSGKSISEIAKQLQKSQKSCENALTRARRKLSSHFA